MIFLQHSTYRLLLMVMFTVLWVRAEECSKKQVITCAQEGGTCVHEDNICPNEMDLPGCGEDEICCTSPTFLKQQADLCAGSSCQNKYKGKCMTNCTSNRIHTGQGNCKTECKCCGCRIKNPCKIAGGHCIRRDVDKCDGTTKNSWCFGNKCACCIPDCPDQFRCRNASGRCDTECNEDEEPNLDISCCSNTHECVCCVPKKEPCRNTTCCEAAGGYCHEKCPFGSSTNRSLCEGDKCTCCLPQLPEECPCHNNTDCRSASGHCAHRCSTGEKADTSIPCRGKDCVCCVPDCECRYNKYCASMKGRCDKRCNDQEVVDTTTPCFGDNCVCCVPRNKCNCTDECLDANGRCDTSCDPDEIRNRIIPCQGNKCFCCVPRHEGDSQTANQQKTQPQQGTNHHSRLVKPTVHPCPYSSEDCYKAGGHCDTCCEEDEIRNITIPCFGDDDDCACCVPKQPCNEESCECKAENGRCDLKCHDNEIQSYNARCQGNGCSCCVPNNCTTTDACKDQGGECVPSTNLKTTFDFHCGSSICRCLTRSQREGDDQE